MRALVLVVLLLFGCGRDGLFDDNSDAAVCEDDMASLFFEDDKLQGSATLLLGAPAVPLIDVRTRDHQPHLVTVTLGNMLGQAPVGIVPFDDLEVVALLEIGVGGIPFIAEVDYAEGVQFSLAANSLRVSARYQHVTTPDIALPPVPSYFAGASIASGVVATGLPPQRTLAYTDQSIGIMAGGSWSCVIPAFAKSFTVQAKPHNAQVLVSTRNSLNTVISMAPVVGFPSNRFFVQNTARSVTLSNTAAGPWPADTILSAYVIFDLAL